MTSLLLSRSSSDSYSFLLSSFSPSESPEDPLADLAPASVSPTPNVLSASPNVPLSSSAPIFEQDPAISNLPSPAFLTSQGSSSLDALPLDLTASIAPVREQIADVGASSGNAMGACTDMDSSQELPILQEQQLSTPTMHPNLVSTLKSIIGPLSSVFPQAVLHQQTQEHTPDNMGVCESVLCAVPAAANVGVPQLQMLFACNNSAASSPITLMEKGREQQQPRHAAIVPIHLIQNRRPYRCSHTGCNKTFKNPQTLKMHHKTHCTSNAGNDNGVHGKGKQLHSLATFPQSCKAGLNKKIPSRCPICKRAFVGLYELRRHFGRKHSEGEKAHACAKCGKRFYIEVDLRDHQKLCGEPLLCKCGMRFAFKCNLVAHKKTHPSCQEEQDQQEFQHSRGGGQTGSPIPQPHATSSASTQPVCALAGSNKAFFVPRNSGDAPMSSPSPSAAMAMATNHTGGCLYPLTSQFNSSSSHIFRPIVKSEQLTCNPWLASAVLGVSRSL